MIICKFCGTKRKAEDNKKMMPCHSTAEFYTARRLAWEGFYKAAMASNQVNTATYLERTEFAMDLWDKEFAN